MFRKRWGLFLVLIVSALVLAACSGGKDGGDGSSTSSEDDGEPKYGGVYKIAQAGDADMLDPHRSSSIYTHGYLGYMYNKLVTYETGPDVEYTDYNVVPDLAEEWDISEDGKEYTFHLREAYWHDIEPVNGRQVVAEDVVATMNRIMTLPGHQLSLLQEVEKVEAKDEKTVVFTLKQPLTPFLNFMANHFMWIIPKEAAEGEVDLTVNAIGTGAFMLEEWEQNVHLKMVKNPNYFEEGKPYLDGVEYTIMQDSGSQLAAFRSGQVDAVGLISPEEIENIKRTNPDTIITENPLPTQIQLAMNMEREPFDDIRVRKAISMALDRQNAVEQIFGGGEISAPVNPTLGDWALPLKEREELQPYDVEEAKKLLTEAGFPDGFETTIMVTNAYGEQPIRMAQWIAEDLRSIGIKAEINVEEYATFYTEKYPAKQYDIVVTYQTYFQEADEWLRTQLLSNSPRNWFGVNDPELDKMLEEQRRVLDEDERLEKVHEIQRYVLENVVNPIPVITNSIFSPRHPYVKNVHSHASYGGIHVKDVWIDK